MVITAAKITEQGVTFAAALVKSYVLNNTADRNQWIINCQKWFGVSNVVLVGENRQTWGNNASIVRFLENIAPEQIPWQQYNVS